MKIRTFQPGDLSPLLTLNNAAAPAVGEVTAEALLDLVNSALICLVVEMDGQPSGMLLCLGDGVEYASPNYRWISEKLTNFAYTDRIFVDEALRGRKAGEALYAALFDHMAGTDRCFVCEVNERPPNPGSLRFHKRLGFTEIGRADHGYTAVVYLKRDAEPARPDGTRAQSVTE